MSALRAMTDDISRLEQELFEYFTAHVHAAESADGVYHCWLPRRPPLWTLEQVREALERMTHAGILEAHLLPGGVPLYRAARRAGGD